MKNMIKTYNLEYNYHDIATVEIDAEKALPNIKEMVEFWSGAEELVDNYDGDYIKAWLNMLVKFIIAEGRKPQFYSPNSGNNFDEGWVETDGIAIKKWNGLEVSDDDIEINEFNL